MEFCFEFEPVPEHAWCHEHRRMMLVTGSSFFMSPVPGESRLLGLYLWCGHRVDPPFLTEPPTVGEEAA